MLKNIKKITATILMLASINAFAQQSTTTIFVSGKVLPGCAILTNNIDLNLGVISYGSVPKGTARIELLCSPSLPYTLNINDNLTDDNIKLTITNNGILINDKIDGVGTGNLEEINLDMKLNGTGVDMGQGPVISKTDTISGSVNIVLTY